MSLKNYIQGKRQGKNANQLEREAMNDPFLQDAIDGFDSVQGEHLPVIEELERQIAKKTTKRPGHYRIWIFSAAASLALLLGISTLMNKQARVEPQVAKQKIENQIDSLKQIAVARDTFGAEKQLAVAKEKPVVKPVLQKKNEPVTETAIAPPTFIARESGQNIENVSIAEIIPSESIKIKSVAIAEQKADQQSIRIRGVSSIPTSQPTMVYGVVLDETNRPLIGANVKYNNGYAGTVTDINGRFTLPTPKDKSDKLVTSYIGYEKNVMALPGDSAIIRLKPDNLALNEVMLVGSTGRKKQLTGINSTSVDEALQGRVAGVDIRGGRKSRIFDESEFKKYFEKNRRQNICANKASSIMVGFYIDESGKATNIQVINCDCAELEAEFKRLIKTCPVWANVNRDVILTIWLK